MIKFKVIKRKKLHIAKLKEEFLVLRSFNLDDLNSFYESLEPGIPRNTVKWRAFELVKLGILIRVGRGLYQIGSMVEYTPDITGSLKSLYKKVKKQFPFIDLCVWDTQFLNEFMIHQPGLYTTLVETESDVAESVFNNIKEFKRNVFLNPDENTIENYLSGEKNPIVIKPLISEAPLRLVDKIETITLEKMLVDIFCDTKLFFTFQGAELKNIFMNAIETYSINQSKLLRYATRRGKKNEIEKLYKQYQTNGNTLDLLPII